MTKKCGQCRSYQKPETETNEKGEPMNGWCFFRKYPHWHPEKGAMHFILPMMAAARACDEHFKLRRNG